MHAKKSYRTKNVIDNSANIKLHKNRCNTILHNYNIKQSKLSNKNNLKNYYKKMVKINNPSKCKNSECYNKYINLNLDYQYFMDNCN